MKRLISWLLALTLVCGLLPLSALAVDIENGDNSDFDVDMWELQVGGSAQNRLLIDFEMNAENTEGTASVTVPAGKTLYAEYLGDPTYELTVDGVAHTFVAATGRTDTNKFEITNNTDAEKTYALKIALPVGTYNNPKVIEAMNWYSDEVTQTLGDYEGYYYIYTAAEDGDVTLYFNAEYDDNGVIDCGDRDIKVTNLNTYSQYSLLENGVDYYGLQLVVPVKAGQQLLINTSWAEDAEGNPFPAGTYSWTGNFSYPAGSEENPIAIEWNWDEDYANATATVTVEADGTYYIGQNGMILTVNGVETAQDNGVFILNAGTYELALATPVGAMNNPEVIENIDGYSDTNSLAADANYNYVWTATEAGTVTLDITDGANITVNKVVGISEEGWEITEQFELATVEYDDNWNASWVAAENLVIEVEAGQELKIQVNGLTDFETYTTPAIDYTLTGDFEAAAVAPEYNVAVSGIALDMAAELFIQAKFLIPAELQADENATVTLEFKGDVTEYNLKALIAEKGLDGKGRLVLIQPVPSPYMDKKITITITDGNGYTADFTEGGVLFEDSYSYGIEEYADDICDLPSMKTTMDAIAALLTYGSYAQAKFSNLPNVSTEPASNLLSKYGYEPEDISTVTIDDVTQTLVNSGADFGVSLRGGTPALDAAVYMDVQFNYDKSVALENLSFVVKYHEAASGKDYAIPVEATLRSNGRILIKIENIAAALFDCIYTVEVTNNLTGEVYSGQYSIYEYIRANIAAGSAVAAVDLNLAKAMYCYNQAANALFE